MKLWSIYDLVESNSVLDERDLTPVITGYRGKNPQLTWGRNVRNVLQSRKRTDIE